MSNFLDYPGYGVPCRCNQCTYDPSVEEDEYAPHCQCCGSKKNLRESQWTPAEMICQRMWETHEKERLEDVEWERQQADVQDALVGRPL